VTIQADAIIASKQQCLCHASYVGHPESKMQMQWNFLTTFINKIE
jgi:hypothetical protein